MDPNVLKDIIDAGVRAPSGENSQPWRFVSRDGKLFLYNVPDRDCSLYNFAQLGSLVSHGAVIENITIAAKEFGYQSSFVLFPLSDEPDCVARLSFEKNDGIAKDVLYKDIFKRASNRNQYASTALEPQAKDALIAAVASIDPGTGLVLLEDAPSKQKAGDALSYGDRLLFENIKIHDFLFSHIYFDESDSLKNKNGFYVKELGLSATQEFVFKLLRSTRVLSFFNKIGFPAVAAKGNSKLYRESSALGAIIIEGNSNKDFVQAGRAIERVWLTATQHGYDIQLVTAIGFFMQRILGNDAADFSSSQTEGIKEAYSALEKSFGAGDKTIGIMFRIGKGKKISYRSPRLEPQIDHR